MEKETRRADAAIERPRNTPPPETGDARTRILEIPFDFRNYRGVSEMILERRKALSDRSPSPACIVLANAWSVELARRDPAFRRAVEDADLCLPDGIGIVLAARLLGIPHRGRVTGPSLMLRLCDWGREAGLRHFFYGGAEGVAEELAARLSACYPGLQVAGTHCPPFRPLTEEEETAIIEKINAAQADLVWVGLGAPKQEKWMAKHRGEIAAAALVGVGAAFDFHSGRKKWAPAWIRRAGLEWAYRFFQEPRRMAGKNLAYAAFVFRVVGQWVREQTGGKKATNREKTRS